MQFTQESHPTTNESPYPCIPAAVQLKSAWSPLSWAYQGYI